MILYFIHVRIKNDARMEWPNCRRLVVLQRPEGVFVVGKLSLTKKWKMRIKKVINSLKLSFRNKSFSLHFDSFINFNLLNKIDRFFLKNNWIKNAWRRP